MEKPLVDNDYLLMTTEGKGAWSFAEIPEEKPLRWWRRERSFISSSYESVNNQIILSTIQSACYNFHISKVSNTKGLSAF